PRPSLAARADEPVPHRRLARKALVSADRVAPRIRDAAEADVAKAGAPQPVGQLESVEELLRPRPLAIRRVHEIVLRTLEDAARAQAGSRGVVTPALALVDQEALVEHRLHRGQHADEDAARTQHAQQLG